MEKVGKFSWLPNSPAAPFAKLLPAKAQKSYVYLSESGHFYVLRISSARPLQPLLMWPPPLGHSLWPRFVSALCVLSSDEGMASLYKQDLIDHNVTFHAYQKSAFGVCEIPKFNLVPFENHFNTLRQKLYGSGGIRTHAPEETGALNQRLRPLGHATFL